MMRCFPLLALLPLLAAGSAARGAEVDRSPVDVLLGPADAWVLTVNQGSSSVSLLDTADGRVLAETPVGERPAQAALLGDGETVLVTGGFAGDVTILRVAAGKIEKLGSMHLGFEPCGIVTAPGGTTAWVALTASGEIVQIDPAERKILQRLTVGQWPRYLAITEAGDRLAVGVSGDRTVAIVDPREPKVLFTVPKFRGLNIGHMDLPGDGFVYFPWLYYGENIPSPGNIRRGWVLGNRVGRAKLEEPELRAAFSLDKEGEAVGDAHGLAFSPNRHWLAVTAGGTHELLLFRNDEGLEYHKVGGTEHIDPALLADRERFSRIELGGRPLGVRIAGDSRTAYVANYLYNSVQVVDLQERRVKQEVHLGGEVEASLARRGEALFYDADRSFDQWYSCHSCHFDGGSAAETFDTLNDGSQYTFKTSPALYDLPRTGPWTWHGWQTDLHDAMQHSFTKTMVGEAPTTAEADAILEFFAQLKRPPNPFRTAEGGISEAAQRGEKLFRGAAACIDCHNGPQFTDGEVHDVGTGDRNDRYRGFNTPSLLGVYSKVRLLHDGRARSLDALLEGPHAPEKVNGSRALTAEERADLVEYLKTL